MTFLFPEMDKAMISILRMKEYEPSEGYYLAFSGGKDSIVLYDLAVQAEVKFDAHYNITTADPPELVKFIRDSYPTVVMDRPERTMWEIIPPKLMPPTRLVRYCCELLKERGGEGRFVLTGIRWQESQKRKRWNILASCPKAGKMVVNPIIDWTEDEVWAYIKLNDLQYPRLYNEGFNRLGCIGCPMHGADGQRRDFFRWPKFRAMYVRSFERMLTRRKERGLETTWKTGEEVMAWWLMEDRPSRSMGRRHDR